MAAGTEGASSDRWIRRLAVLSAALFAAGLVLAVWHWLATAPDETDPTPVRIALGDQPLVIPGNMIRFDDQRRETRLPRVDLAVLWPELTGRTAETAERFDDLSAESRVVSLALEPKDTDMDAADRLASVYVRFLEPGEVAGPVGLTARRFRAETPYAGETLYFEPGSVRPFVARCFPRTGTGPDDLCLTEFRLGRSLVASYRFRPVLLGDWRSLRTRVEDLAAGLLASSGS